jgi:hypothetical protein
VSFGIFEQVISMKTRQGKNQMTLTPFLYGETTFAVITGSGSGSGNGIQYGYTAPNEAKEARLEALRAQHDRFVQRVAFLERFNGLTFVDVKEDKVTTGAGTNVSVIAYTRNSNGSWGRKVK